MSATNPLKTRLDAASPNTIADLWRLLKLGGLLRGQFPQVLRGKTPALDGSAPASTVQTIVLPQDARAGAILRCVARGGSGAGEQTIDAPLTTVSSSGHCAIQPDGNVALLAADAATGVDLIYLPERGDVVILATVPVASNAYVFPAALLARKPVLLLSAVSLAGTLTGNLRIAAPSASAASTGLARLDLAKASVKFASADAVTSAAITLLVSTADDLDLLLESEATTL